jgi:SMC interacting uncharacterized protein involved in chromosome segregation
MSEGAYPSAPDSKEFKLARVEADLANLRSVTDKMQGQLDDVRINYVKKADLNDSKDEILEAIKELRKEFKVHQTDTTKTHKELTERADKVDKHLASQDGSISIIGWVARTSFGAALVAGVGWVIHKLS